MDSDLKYVGWASRRRLSRLFKAHVCVFIMKSSTLQAAAHDNILPSKQRMIRVCLGTIKPSSKEQVQRDDDKDYLLHETVDSLNHQPFKLALMILQLHQIIIMAGSSICAAS